MNTLIGFACGIIVLVVGITSNGDLRTFFNAGSILITIGGTLAALIINYPFKVIKSTIVAVFTIPFKRKPNPFKIIDNIVELAEQARESGLLSLEDKVDEYNNDFLKKGILSITASHDTALVRKDLETDLDFMEQRHAAVHSVLEKGAAYSPAFGMTGTLVGLINMLKHLNEDQSALGPNMSIALVTTFYGVVISNLVFHPLAGRLKKMSEEEIICKQLIIDGVIAIQEGQNPRLIKEKMLGLFSQKNQSVKRRLNAKEVLEIGK